MKNVLKFLIPVVIFVVTLGGLFYFYEKTANELPIEHRDVTITMIEKGLPEKDSDPSRPFLPFEMAWPANSKIRVVSRTKGKVTFDINYHIDENHLRKNPEVKREQIESTYFVGGCSFTFGEWLKDEETFPAYLQSLDPSGVSINLGIPGGGLHTLHRYFDTVGIKKLYRGGRPVFVYVYILEHLIRWHARPLYFTWVHGTRPHYAVENGEVVYKGLIQEHPLFKAHEKAKKLGFDKTWWKVSETVRSDFDWNSKELEEFSVGVLDLKKKFLQTFPDGEFYFVFHPYHNTLEHVRKELAQIISAKGIRTINADEGAGLYFNKKGKGLTFNLPDGHPNGLLNKYFAEWILEALNQSPIAQK